MNNKLGHGHKFERMVALRVRTPPWLLAYPPSMRERARALRFQQQEQLQTYCRWRESFSNQGQFIIYVRVVDLRQLMTSSRDTDTDTEKKESSFHFDWVCLATLGGQTHCNPNKSTKSVYANAAQVKSNPPPIIHISLNHGHCSFIFACQNCAWSIRVDKS